MSQQGINQTLGGQFPEVTLSDGSKVQTGTFGALLTNIRKYNEIHAALESGGALGDEKTKLQTDLAAVEEQMAGGLPLLKKVGLFDLFTPEEWINDGGRNPGRVWVGRRAKAL